MLLSEKSVTVGIFRGIGQGHRNYGFLLLLAALLEGRVATHATHTHTHQ